ncbi:HPr family phosphocarrier protein [Consotaella salsifontis]|uniref:Phosphocarrier protein n=1 Tax=Consotaella salsifontis TaxID=1365950 RepID=A0A1T4QHX0_9HYPH|nr:HPr family phosphocarrier protein [Consotaella salsifontis]SKA03319.1 phosphocarrier protein [Consotaella salsifontis]
MTSSSSGQGAADPIHSPRADDPALLKRTLAIVNKRGLHARASARFVQVAEVFDAELTISRDSMSVGGLSIMGLMMLGAAQGTTIEVTATGREAEEALDAITALVADCFGEGC